jgi:WD40 repeat protein
MIRVRQTLIFGLICLTSLSTALGQSPQLVVQTGHGQAIYTLAISPDKKILASAGADKKIIIWDIATGRQMYALTEHTQTVMSLAFNREGNLLASGGADGGVKIWDVRRGVKVEALSLQPKGVTCLAFSPDGKYLAVAGTEKVIDIWELASRKVTSTLTGYKDVLEKIVFSSDGKLLVSFGRDHSLVAWALGSWKPYRVTVYEPHIIPDNTLAISPDGTLVAVTSFSGNILIWDLARDKTESIPFPAGAQQVEAQEADSNAIQHVVFASNQELICDVNAEIVSWNFRTKEVKKIANSPHSSGSALSISADSKFLAYSFDDTIKTVELDTNSQREFLGGFEPIMTLEFWSNGRTLITNGITAHFFGDPFEFTREEAGPVLAKLNGSRYEYIPAINTFARFGETESGPGVGNIELRIFDSKEKAPPRIVKAHPESINAMSAQTNGQLFATCGKDKTLKIWNVFDWEKPLRILNESAQALAFSSDGKWLAIIIEERKVKLFDTKSWQSRDVYKRDDGGLGHLFFTPDSSKIVFHVGYGIGDQYLMVFDINDKKPSRTLKLSALPSKVDLTDFLFNQSAFPGLSLMTLIADYAGSSQVRGPLSFSKDKETSLIAYQYKDILRAENSIKIWNLRSGAELTNLAGHTGVIRTTAFSPNNKILASGSTDTTVKLWDIEKGTELATISTLDNKKWVIYTSEGRFDTNTDIEDGNILHWSLPGNALATLPLDVFMRDYYEPKLFDRLIACTENNTCDKGEFKKIRSLSELNIVRPEVKITSMSLPDADRRVTVEVEVTNVSGMVEQGNGQQVKRVSGVYDLRVFRDRQLVGYWPSEGAARIERRKTEIDQAAVDRKFETELKIWRESTKLQLDPKTGKQTVSFQVQLPRGKDASSIKFTAYAFNEDRVKSETARYEWATEQKQKLPQADANVTRRAYVISVGVNNFQLPGFNLSKSNYDADQFQRVIPEKLRQTGNYDIIPIRLVTAYEDGELIEKATKENIEAVFEMLSGKEISAEKKQKIPNSERIRRSTPDDLIIVTFSTHGYSTRGGDFYLLPSNLTRQTEGQKLPDLSSMISGEELGLWVRDVEANQMVWIIDACQSAAAIESLDFKPGPLGSRGFGQLAYDKRMRVLVATQASNAAIQVDGQIKGGLLTEALIAEGLVKGNADTDENGDIMLDEWLEYGESRVPELFRTTIKELETTGVENKSLVLKLIYDSKSFDLKQLMSLQRASFFNFSQGSNDVLVSPAVAPPMK